MGTPGRSRRLRGSSKKEHKPDPVREEDPESSDSQAIEEFLRSQKLLKWSQGQLLGSHGILPDEETLKKKFPVSRAEIEEVRKIGKPFDPDAVAGVIKNAFAFSLDPAEGSAEQSPRPRLTIRLLSPHHHYDDRWEGVSLNGTRVRLSSGYLNVFRLLIAVRLGRPPHELGVPTDKRVLNVIAKRLYELRDPTGKLIRNRGLRAAVVGLQLPVPLVDPQRRRFHPGLEISIA